MFLQLRAEAAEALAAALDAEGYPTGDLGLEEPPEDVDAVLASSVAFRLAGEAGAPPPTVAAELAGAVDAADLTYVDRVEPAGPYVNVHPAEAYLTGTIEAAAGDDYGSLPDRDTSVVVEHTSANPTGPVHVGRARNPIIGDALARVLEYAGYDVETHYYVNDAGRQIATFTWAYETFDEADLADAGYAEPERDKPDYDLVRYYRAGNAFLDGDHPDADPDSIEDAEAEIQAIMQGLEAGEEAAHERVAAVVDTVLEGMRASLERLPAEFDEFVKETRFIRDGSTDDVIARLRETEHAQRTDDGAWELDLSAFGFEKSLVFVRSDGTSLYTTRDLAHHEWKFEQFDRAVTVLGEDHKLQAEQLAAALELLGNDTDRLDSIHYSWVTLPEGGMSTREGTGIDLDDLLDEAVARARQEYEDRAADRIRDDDLSEADVDRIARQVGIGAVRYDIVAKQPTKQLTFEWERALDFEAQSAPYVQYAHARCCGILDEARAAGLDVPAPGAVDAAALEEPAARDLLRSVARFPAVIEEAAEDLEPHAVATYVRRLADRFNGFYRECPVLDAEGDLRDARLATVVAARTALSNGLDALGVAAPESM